MHPSKVVKDPKINDTYYDPDVDKLYQYVKIGDFPPEWVLTYIDEDDDYGIIQDFEEYFSANTSG